MCEKGELFFSIKVTIPLRSITTIFFKCEVMSVITIYPGICIYKYYYEKYNLLQNVSLYCTSSSKIGLPAAALMTYLNVI